MLRVTYDYTHLGSWLWHGYLSDVNSMQFTMVSHTT